MITKAQIETFFTSGPIALVGVSRNPKKFGYMVLETLTGKNKYSLLPVNPNADEILGNKCYRDLQSLPADCVSIHIMTGKNMTAGLVRMAIDKGMKNIWIQQGSETPEAVKLASDSGANVIHHKCIMMFADPQGFHKFHRNLLKFFGRLPK